MDIAKNNLGRLDFLKLSACAAAASAWTWDGFAATAGDEIVRHDAPPRNRRPYVGVDWANAFQIRTTSHGHCDNQKMLDAYLKRGFELLTVSNYYPSAPRYPLKDVRENSFRLHHDFPVMVNGKRVDGPFDWNKIVGEWVDTLPEEQRREYPFKEGKKLFKPIPAGILEAPNAEHHFFLDPKTKKRVSKFHMCNPGSAFASGTFDKRDKFKSHSRGWCFGSGEPWPIAIDRMIAGLICPDGGGVTINHPTWSDMDYDFPAVLLDHDPRVLGLEVINNKYLSEDYWDHVLRTGRQCFGFFVPDWGLWRGCNVLLVKERTVEACLRAYRQGNFYGAVFGNRERFEHISFDGRKLDVSIDRPMKIEVIGAKGVIASKTDKGIAIAAPADAKANVYLRVKASATDDSGEMLFSQPFMLT